MDELDKLDKKVLEMFHKYKEAGGDDEIVIMSRNDFDKNARAAGYIKLPGNAQNVTITTSDNPTDVKLMTEQEWRAKFGSAYGG